MNTDRRDGSRRECRVKEVQSARDLLVVFLKFSPLQLLSSSSSSSSSQLPRPFRLLLLLLLSLMLRSAACCV